MQKIIMNSKQIDNFALNFSENFTDFFVFGQNSIELKVCPLKQETLRQILGVFGKNTKNLSIFLENFEIFT